jgi:hypothetical protein
VRSKSLEKNKPITFLRLTVMNYDKWSTDAPGVVAVLEDVDATVPPNLCLQSASSTSTVTPTATATPQG